MTIEQRRRPLMSNQPWVSGPLEILEHGISLLETDNDVNRRIAIILIDNSVELSIKTYLSLPKRITGIGISRKEYIQIGDSFPRLLDAIEKYAHDKLEGINLGEIEWYHRLRNELYHQGNGLTVERAKVEVYAELAKLLIGNLFQIKITIHHKKNGLSEFLSLYIELEQALAKLTQKYIKSLSNDEITISSFQYLELLCEGGILTRKVVDQLNSLRMLRNKVVHGEISPEEIPTSSLSDLVEITKKLKLATNK
jgi:hypothetical protein